MIPGAYTVIFNTEGLSNGVYYGVLKVGETVYSKKNSHYQLIVQYS